MTEPSAAPDRAAAPLPEPGTEPGRAAAPLPEPGTEPGRAAAPLPEPGRTRWQPLRVGLIDLFYYDVEEFWFRDGRLLLRGNNGTGKSKVLALTLPFLLDGELSAYRVEPDADPKKRMEWNLLLGGEHPHSERLGYTWIEFGRITENGAAEYRTLGCGLKAVAGRGIARHWFFTTPQRVGVGLRLLDATRTALSRDRLADALDGGGMVYDQAGAYRRAVDEALFGLGEQRYAALVDLLVQLRQPQLSKRPSEAALSKALTEALPPMEQAVVADVAEAFRSLDDEEAELDSMVEAEQAASSFLQHYRRYARVAARRKAAPLRAEHSRYEKLNADLNEAQGEQDGARSAVEAADAALAEAAERRARLQAEDAALRRTPEMDSAAELDRARVDAEQGERRSRRAAADSDRARGQSVRAERRLADAVARRDTAADRFESALVQAGDAAVRASVGAGHAERVEGPLRSGAAGAQRAADDLVDRRLRAVEHVEVLGAAAERAEADRVAAEQRLSDIEAELGALSERLTAAQDDAEGAAADHVTAVRDHLAGCGELRPDDPEGLLDGLQSWTGTLAGPNPARSVAERTARGVESALAAEEARLDVEGDALAERRTALTEELAELRAGGQRGPRPPHTRAADARAGRPGAPLWRVVDFADGFPAHRRAPLEAALEASGLLDAWISPDGAASDPDTHDVLVTAADPVAGPALGRALRPAVDRADSQAAEIAPETLTRLLASIGLGASSAPTWVDDAGGYRVGALRGSWRKDAAQYVGEGAREEARRGRIAAAAAELEEVGAAVEALDGRRAAVGSRRSVLGAELAAFPDDSRLRAAHAALAESGEGLARTRVRRDERADTASTAATAATAAAEERDRTAAELGLPSRADELREVRDGIGAYRVALAALWPAAGEDSAAAGALRSEREDAEQARANAADLAERAEDARLAAATATQRHTTLEATVGAAVAELNRMLERVGGELRACDGTRQRAESDRSDALVRQGKASGRIEQLEADIEEKVRSRADTVEALRRFTDTGLLAVALPGVETPSGEGPWAPIPAVLLARSVERELADVDDSTGAWERVQRRIAEELKNLQEALSRHGHSATHWTQDDGVVVRVSFQGREQEVPALTAALGEEVAERRRMLSAHEREILENHLLTEVAGTLQELIEAAEAQVGRMNAELGERPTSTGMRLRLVWRQSKDAPDGLGAARERLLRQSIDAWSPEDRAAVGAFLQDLVARAKAADPAGSWLDRLTRALDYRAWHVFGVERHQNGQWRSATGPASGGERVLSVSIPLFAAASSHYATAANRNAPRLITLDEAFAGVDDDSRAKCLGLLHAFDLDVVMTSEREWGCYPQVPGLAIAQLSRVEDVAAVLVTRWEWDGRERTRGTEPDVGPDAGPAVPARSGAGADQEVLWG
ncbi:uncharacterized protein (TIGR02680 family) [Murinocardiopsis flavida]|uniref:Uncharacterized protein (TIGR02680 family) n=1 Tax=Murinocardiopsis flavida TaxID=645275 RepID=A0A2P8DEU7_9ACTN|nr:TIGR02680 family protein [Murinocardiopsis flavida]PSK95745.1 uncharacterized protein (TIGR02680 family) [Murinocardiopsis flavida]